MHRAWLPGHAHNFFAGKTSVEARAWSDVAGVVDKSQAASGHHTHCIREFWALNEGSRRCEISDLDDLQL